MAEVETPTVTSPEALVPTRSGGASLLDRWVQHDPKMAIERVETMVKVLEQLRTASIRATYPADWIIHTTKTRDGEVVKQVGYLQDSGAERAGKVWGIEVGNPAIEREDFPDGTYSYHMIAEAWSKVTGERLDYAEGSRWSGDSFFQRPRDPDYKIDPTDVRKSAYANLHGRAVRALSGLNGVPLEMLRQAGLDVGKVVHVNYDTGSKGGESTGASVGTSDLTIAWGNAKGTKVVDLTDKDLDYYIGAHERDLANPEKAKFKKNNERMLTALKAEKEKRARGVEQEQETGTEQTPTRGRRIGDLHVRLNDAASNDGKKMATLLKAITKEHLGAEKDKLSDLSDDELDKLNAIPEDVLKAVVSALGKGGAK